MVLQDKYINPFTYDKLTYIYLEMPITDSPWGSYFGMFRDKYVIEWMVDFGLNHNGETGK